MQKQLRFKFELDLHYGSLVICSDHLEGKRHIKGLNQASNIKLQCAHLLNPLSYGALVFYLLPKMSSGSPYLKILDLAKRFVVDTPMNRRKKQFYPLSKHFWDYNAMCYGTDKLLTLERLKAPCFYLPWDITCSPPLFYAQHPN